MEKLRKYFQIGKSIVEEQNGEERAEYGTGLLKELSNQMTRDFGKGFTVANLKNMRQFYLTFPKSYALRSELSWTHYRLLMRVENENARQFYMEEAVKSQWSTRQLERQINTFFYERLLSSKNKEYERELMNEGDNPPIGIVLCADKSDAVVRYTLPESETQVLASKCKLYLPSEEELLKELKREYQAMEAAQPDKE